MLSIITTGRDDDYGIGFLERFYCSLKNNLEFLYSNNIEYEYLVCEWNPQKKYLIDHPNFQDLFKNYNLRDIVITSKVVEKENLKQNIFYEYFAKNCGVRNSKYDNIMIVNSDIIIPNDSFLKIKNILSSGLDEQKFYRLRYRQQVLLEDTENVLINEDIYYPNNPDAIICGYCSGDFLLLNKQSFINYGKGYDEMNPQHRTVSQTAMDGELLWNLHYAGLKIELIPYPYKHINHGKFNSYDSCYNQFGYINKPNWGFIDYQKQYLQQDKLLIIHGGE